MGDEFEVDPAALRATAGQLDEHAGEVASHGETLGANTAARVGRGAIGEVVESAVRRGIGIVVHDVSAAVRKFYADAAMVMRKAAAETERRDGEAKQAFDHLGPAARAGEAASGGAPAREAPVGKAKFSSPEVASAWNIGIDTRAGRAYYEPRDTRLRTAAEALPPFPREYTVDLHGTPARVVVGDSALDAGQLAELVKADPNWNNRPVRLFSCLTGKGDRPIARELADHLGVKVTAPADLVWSDPTGRYFVAPGVWKTVGGTQVMVPGPEVADGGWRTFRPERHG
jgi:hypothetical protein